MNRKWVATIAMSGVLLTLPAFQGSASAAGSGLPVRGVVAAIASDSAASTGVSVGHITISQSPGGPEVWIYGDVTNGTGQAIGSVHLTVTAYDASGTRVTTQATSPLVSAIAPAGIAPFRVKLSAAAISTTIATATASVDSFQPAPATAALAVALAGPRDVPIGDPDKNGVQPLSPDLYGIDGTVWNNSGSAVQLLGASIAVYDGSGNVAAIVTGGALKASNGSTPPVLQPGDSASFTAYISRSAYLGISGSTHLVAFVDTAPVSS